MKKIKLGARGSKLSLIQTNSIKEYIENKLEDVQVEIVPISTIGDRDNKTQIKDLGQSVFSSEIEKQLIEGNIDFAIHSMKDLPSKLGQDLILLPPIKSQDYHDVLVGKNLEELNKIDKPKIGTGSIRRRHLIKKLVPNAQIVPIRGNVETRISKLETLGLDSVILAYAGIKRLGYGDKISQILPSNEFLYAPCQGLIGIESKKDNPFNYIFEQDYDEQSKFRMDIERRFQINLDAKCSMPMGIYYEVKDKDISIKGCFGDEEEKFCIKEIFGELKDVNNLIDKLCIDLKKEIGWKLN